jgi:hypothetical protein
LSCLTGPLNFGICCAAGEYYSKDSNSCSQSSQSGQTSQSQCPANCLKCVNGVCIVCDNNLVMVLNTCIELSNDPDVNFLALTTGTIINITIKNPITDIINKNMGMKKTLNTAFGLLGSIDDLWIFSYHERNYTLTVALLLNYIRQF